MERKTLGAIAIGIVILMIIVVVVSAAEGGLPREIRNQYDREKILLQSSKAQLVDTKDSLSKLIDGKHSAWLAPLAEREGWLEGIDDCHSQLDQVQTKFQTEAAPIFEQDKKDDRGRLGVLLTSVESQRASALVYPTQILERSRALVDFAENRQRYVDEALANAQKLKNLDFSALRAEVEQAQEDWPEKKSDLETRLSSLTSLPERAQVLSDAIGQMAAEDVSEVDISDFQSKVTTVSKLADSGPSGVVSLDQLVDQLYSSYDKVLSDMEIREGSLVEFYHQYRVLRIDRSNTSKESTEWVKVDKQTFDRNERNLGMTVESKPKGLYDFEATKVASPPGYSYVGNSHYGRWENRGGSRFWVFYGQYAFMRDMFWGPRLYTPVRYSTYSDYRRTRDSGKAYYGKNSSGKALYGSTGSYTKSRYTQSKYVKSDGYKNTQYRKSGGSYRGTRYASRSRSSSSSSSYRRGSRSSGGSRSFGK